MPKKISKSIEFVPFHHSVGSGKTKVKLSLPEMEAMRLVDYVGKSQVEAAKAMEVSRATIQRLLTSGRKKAIASIMFKEKIVLKADETMESGNMKVGFINVNGSVGGHLGHAKNITLYDFEKDNFSNHTPEVTGGGARAKWLYDAGVKAIVLTSSGAGAIKHMDQLGIKVLNGSGLTIEEALELYKKEGLEYFDINEAGNGCGGHTHDEESKTECCEGEDEDCGCEEEKDEKVHSHGGCGCGCH